jgi:hypothetical protein
MSSKVTHTDSAFLRYSNALVMWSTHRCPGAFILVAPEFGDEMGFGEIQHG